MACTGSLTWVGAPAALRTQNATSQTKADHQNALSARGIGSDHTRGMLRRSGVQRLNESAMKVRKIEEERNARNAVSCFV